MATILTVILAAISVLMVFLIMLQEGKGGGMAALGGTKAAAIEGVTNPIRRATAYMAIIFFMLAVTLGLYNRPKASSIPFEEDKPVIAPAAAAVTPATTTVGTPVVPAVPPIKVEAQPVTVNPGNLPPAPAVPVAPANPIVPPAPAVNVVPVAPVTGAQPAPVVPVAPKPDAPKTDASKTDVPKSAAPVDPEKK